MNALTVSGLGVAWQGTPVVRDVSLALAPGDGLALVGGSGAGKTSIALAIAGLLPPGAAVTGTVQAAGRIGFAFQDVGAGLNPVIRVGRQVAETVSRERGEQAMRDAGLDDPAEFWNRYPHELSGGQRQRIMLAIALARDPAVLIADEPTTALDPTLRVALLDRLAALRQDRGLALLLITHDLGAARLAASRVAVLADGVLVEAGHVEELLRAPRSEAGRALVAAMPRLAGVQA